jgi:hypothetical protein
LSRWAKRLMVPPVPRHVRILHNNLRRLQCQNVTA